MKLILSTVLCLIQILCFSQKKSDTEYQKIEGKDFFIYESTEYNSPVKLCKKTYTGRNVSGNEIVHIEKGNYIVEIDDFYMKFSIDKDGNLDGYFEMLNRIKKQLRKQKMVIKNGFIQTDAIYDSIGTMEYDVKRYYYKDSIIYVMTKKDRKFIQIKFLNGKTITKEYDKNGKIIDIQEFMTAGIGR